MNKALVGLNIDFKGKLNTLFKEKGIFVPNLTWYVSVSSDYGWVGEDTWSAWVMSSVDGEKQVGKYPSEESAYKGLEVWCDEVTTEELYEIITTTLARNYTDGFSEHYFL